MERLGSERETTLFTVIREGHIVDDFGNPMDIGALGALLDEVREQMGTLTGVHDQDLTAELAAGEPDPGADRARARARPPWRRRGGAGARRGACPGGTNR